MKIFRKYVAILAVVSASSVALSSAAVAGCSIHQNNNFSGKSENIGNNKYVKFSGNAPARKYPTSENFWWHNRVSSVKLAGGCKAVFFGSHGSKYTHFIINKSGNLPNGQRDLTQGVTCEC